jgi:transposase
MNEQAVYIGMDVHSRTCTYAVLDQEGQMVFRATVATELEGLRRCLERVSGKRHVAIENGTQAAWLYHGLREACESMIVANMCGTRNYRKMKSDPIDAAELANLLRKGVLKPVYMHTREDQEALMQAARCYEQLNQNVVRAKNRVKAVYLSLGMNCPGAGVYGQKERERWLEKLAKRGHRNRARLLLEGLDELLPLKKKAQKRMIQEARKQRREFAIVRSVPGMGPVSGARLMGHMGTPERFSHKRKLWKASGLAVVTHSSADYRLDPGTGEIVEHRRLHTRGLNQEYNRAFKSIFKSAASYAIRSGVFKEHYDRRIDEGMRPSMIRLTIARKIAAAVLACLQRGEMFDPEKMKPSGS